MSLCVECHYRPVKLSGRVPYCAICHRAVAREREMVSRIERMFREQGRNR